MPYSRGPNIYDPNLHFGMDNYYTQNQMEELDMESEFHEIKSLLSADNYIVTEMSEEEFNTRHILYNRFRKWMIENDQTSGMFQKFTEGLHLQFCEEKKRDHDNKQMTKSGFVFCCPICKENVKIVEKTKLLKNGNDGNYYLLSNVIRHLRRVHLKRLGFDTTPRKRNY